MVSYGHSSPQITYRCNLTPSFFHRASDVPAMFAVLLEYTKKPANTVLIITVFLALKNGLLNRLMSEHGHKIRQYTFLMR